LWKLQKIEPTFEDKNRLFLTFLVETFMLRNENIFEQSELPFRKQNK
jgi:hypothetical protein